jgi:hypothetical protein
MVNSGEFVPKRVTAPPIWFTVNRILTRQHIDKYREFGDDSPSPAFASSRAWRTAD